MVLLVLLLLFYVASNVDAFYNDDCAKNHVYCLSLYTQSSTFIDILPPWDVEKMDLDKICLDSYRTQQCLHSLIFDSGCHRQIISDHMTRFQSQFGFLCDGYNTPYFTKQTAKALLESHCVTDAAVAFNMRVSIEVCKEAFDMSRSNYCLLNQGTDACVMNAVRFHCRDAIFRNYFESVWFTGAYDVTNGTHGPEGPCYYRTSQLHDLLLVSL